MHPDLDEVYDHLNVIWCFGKFDKKVKNEKTIFSELKILYILLTISLKFQNVNFLRKGQSMISDLF